MEESNRKLLADQKEKLVELINFDTLVTELETSKIFTTPMLDDIKNAGPAQYDKNRLLLEYLPKRGPKAFASFFDCLMDSDNVSAARILNDIVPDTGVWNGEIRPAVNKKIAEGYYPMTRRPRGLALILSYKVYKAGVPLRSRYGGEVDERNLETLFVNLGFEVALHENKTHEETRQILINFRKDGRHSKADCCIITILSHGDREGFFCADGKLFKEQVLMDNFNNFGCAALIGKPKVFFLQYCRGDKDDHAIPIECSDSDVSTDAALQSGFSRISLAAASDDNAIPNESWDKIVTTDAQPSGGPISPTTDLDVATVTDIFKCYSTTDGYVSLRDQHKGTLYISSLVTNIGMYAYDRNLDDIMLEVNGNLNRITRGCKKLKQSAEISKLGVIKKLYFNPGLYDD